jgi:glycosyltransferase involved in cell wall biosynthesis
MKLAFVSTIGFPWGGCEVLWTATAREALRQGHEVLVSVFDWPDQHPDLNALKEAGAMFHYRKRFFPPLPKRLAKKFSNLALPAGKKRTYHDYLTRYKPDLIFFNLAGGDELVRSSDDWMIFLRQTTIPFVVMYHSLSDRPQFSESIIGNYWFQTGKAKANLFTSRLQQQWLEHQIAASIPAASIIHHPLNIKGNATPSYPSMEIIQFATVGSLVCRWKGQDILLKVLAEPRWQQREWLLNIYGEGEDRFYLERLAAHYGIKERVIFQGHVNNISRIWETNHMLLAPSRQDSGPIVCYEAMYYARPVVGSFMGAMPEFIRNEETGILAKGIGERDFAEALETAWQHRQQWKTWGENGRKYLDQHYDYDAARTLLNLLTQQ